jgi:hypothetical protein
MLLMGMWMSLTKKPMNPMMANPMAVAMAIFWNSFLSGLVHRFTSLQQQEIKTIPYIVVDSCGSGMFIPYPNLFRPGSRIQICIKEFKQLNPKNCFQELGIMIRGVHPGFGS